MSAAAPDPPIAVRDFDEEERRREVIPILTNPAFVRAVTMVPRADIAYVQAACRGGETRTDDEVAHMLAFNRWYNKICDNCGDKDDPTALLRCARCGLVWYCGRACQRAHWAKHRLRCAKLDGPLDDGPQAIRMIKMGPPDAYGLRRPA